jgi:AraC-like DNA-binding protein
MAAALPTPPRFLAVHPAAPLGAFVESLWIFEAPPRAHALERIMPYGAAQLIVNLAEDETRVYHPERADGGCQRMSGTVLSGACSRYGVIDTAEQQFVAGVSFKPGGMYPFFGVPAHDVTNAHVELADLWRPRAAVRLRERLLEAPDAAARLDVLTSALIESRAAVQGRRRSTADPLHPAVAHALRVFGRSPRAASIGEVTAAIGLSAKRFIERFKTEVGLTPKAFCRVRRFQQALGAMTAGADVDWACVALSAGYYDQAHFIHDFRAFSGMTPGAYARQRGPQRNHVPLTD